MFDLTYEKVLKFATKKHEGQLRKDGVPYITHPIRVSKIVRAAKPHSKNLDILIAAALLHDTLEDTNTSFKELNNEFGEYVASLVVELSSAPFAANYLGKAQYMCKHMINMTPYALIIKLADRLDNVTDMKGYSRAKKLEKYAETKEILEFLKQNRSLTKIHEILINMIENYIKEQEIKLNSSSQ